MKLPCLAEHQDILMFLGFRDFRDTCPPPSERPTDAQIDDYSPKSKLVRKMKKWGCPCKMTETIPTLKDRFKLFVRDPPPPIDATSAWHQLAPILLAAMILKPLDDTKIRSLRLGIQNEAVVLQRLRSDLATHVNQDQIGPTYKIGLAASREAQDFNMASSPDAVQMLNGSAALVEVKTSTTASTAQALQDLVNVDGKVFDQVNFHQFSDSVFENPDDESINEQCLIAAIPEQMHRVQCVHHAASIGVGGVLYVQADLIATRRVRFLHFTPEIRHAYLVLINALLSFIDYYTFIHDLPEYPKTPQSRVAAETINFLTKKAQYCRDAYSVAQYFALGKLIRSQNVTPPSCYKIKYAPFHVWNSRKGHSDTSSQQKSVIGAYFHQDAAVYLAIRLLDSQTLNFLKIARLIETLPQLEATETLAEFRRKLSRKTTLREFLAMTADEFIRAFSYTNGSEVGVARSSSQNLDHPPPTLHRGLSHYETLRLQTEYGTEHFSSWMILKEHLPEVLSKSSLDCCIPGCDRRTRWGCKKCNLRLCWSKKVDESTQESCWFHLHELIFRGKKHEFFDQLRSRRSEKRVESTNSGARRSI